MSASQLEAELALQIRALGLPEPIREYQAIKGRKFRFDFAWPGRKAILEFAKSSDAAKRLGLLEESE